jgi:hypothetical protein
MTGAKHLIPPIAGIGDDALELDMASHQLRRLLLQPRLLHTNGQNKPRLQSSGRHRYTSKDADS